MSFKQEKSVCFQNLVFRTHIHAKRIVIITWGGGLTTCDKSNTRITNHELIEGETVSIYAWYQMIGHVVQSRNQLPHLCVQILKLSVTVCQLRGHSTQTSTLYECIWYTLYGVAMPPTGPLRPFLQNISPTHLFSAARIRWGREN